MVKIVRLRVFVWTSWVVHGHHWVRRGDEALVIDVGGLEVVESKKPESGLAISRSWRRLGRGV
jgi:hypothetical protein